ncbi:MAG: hypothetical protein V3T39_04325, partial [Gammaproteobacteria bacterium]
PSGAGTMQVATGSPNILVANINNTLEITVDQNAIVARGFATAAGVINLVRTTAQVTSSSQLGSTREQSGGLADEGFIDPSLFEDISLYEVFGTGIRLPADQSEEEIFGDDCDPADVNCQAQAAPAGFAPAAPRR